MLVFNCPTQEIEKGRRPPKEMLSERLDKARRRFDAINTRIVKLAEEKPNLNLCLRLILTTFTIKTSTVSMTALDLLLDPATTQDSLDELAARLEENIRETVEAVVELAPETSEEFRQLLESDTVQSQ